MTLKDPDWIVVRDTGTTQDGVWYDRRGLPNPLMAVGGEWIHPSGEFESSHSGRIAEVWAPLEPVWGSSDTARFL